MYLPKILLLLLVSIASPIIAGDVSWLEKVTAPPADLLTTPRVHLRRLLPDGEDKVNAQSSWALRRKQLRDDWLKILGPLAQPPAQGLKLQTKSVENLLTCTRTLVTYETEPGWFVKAYILRPSGDTQTTRPGIVVFHPTNKESIKVVAGTGGRPDQHIALRLVEQGFVCICPENYINQESTWKAAAAAAHKRHPHSTGMATMLADGMRAVDVLSALPGVDPTRIGTIGHSLGAKEVLYLMAFDDRVKAGVFSEGGIGLPFSNWDADWYLGSKIKTPNFNHDHHELLAMIAPRPLLIFGGENGRAADGDRTWQYIGAADKIYQLFGKPVRLGFINHHEGHMFSPAMVDKGMEWLTAYLQP